MEEEVIEIDDKEESRMRMRMGRWKFLAVAAGIGANWGRSGSDLTCLASRTNQQDRQC